MASYTAEDVKRLRELTAAGMVDCKKALDESGGDFDKAVEIIRVKGLKGVTKREGRTTSNGLVVAKSEGDVTVMLELNCETDFVAKNDDFLGFAADLARIAMDQASVTTVDTLSAQPLSGQTVEEVRTALVGKLGENVSVRRFQRIEAKGRFYTYIHGGAKIGVLLDLVGGDETLGRDIAMHIAASKPRSLDSSGVDAQLIEAERRVAKEKAAESGKSPEIAEKMVEGAVQKFLKEVTLLGQVFVKAEDGKQTIEQLLKVKSASIASFVLYIVGEGIEKKQSDFAAEVAAQSAAARAA